MKKLIYLLVSGTLLWACTDQKSQEKKDVALLEASAEQTETVFDSTLAAQLGADQYGMKSYVMVFLKKGPNRPQDSVKAAELQKAHMENIGRLAEEGKLIMAGPFFGKGDLRGIYLFDVKTVEEAKKLTESDPAIQAGSLIMEMHPWYGSAALMKIDEIHRKIAKIYI